MSSIAPLSPDPIDRFLQALRDHPGDHISRGRVGVGYAFRAGRYVRITLDEDLSWERVFEDEAELRAYLRALPMSDAVGAYDRAVMQGLGAF